MSREEVKEGQAWVAQLATERAAARGLALTSVQWIRTTEGFNKGFELFIALSGTREVRERFSEISLEDHNTPSVRGALARQIEQVLLRIKEGERG